MGGAGAIVLAAAAAATIYGGFGGGDKPTNTSSASTNLMVPGPLGEQALGKDDAPVTIIEYASMTCPHCAHFHEKTYPELKKRYIDTGKVRFIFREFPLDDVAMMAAMLARCVEKDKFFPFIEVLFQQQDNWAVRPPASPLPPLLVIAKQAGFSEESFNACLKNQNTFDGILWSYQRGAKLGVNSTPAFFINGKLHAGVMTIEEMAKLIEPLLKS